MTFINQFGFEDFVSRISNVENTDFSLCLNKIMIFDIGGNHWLSDNGSPLMKIDAFCLMMVETGECVFNIDYRSFRVGKNMAIILLNRHITQFVSASEDFKSHTMLVDIDFTRSRMKSKLIETAVLTASAPAFFNNQVVQFEQNEFILLRDNLERLRRNIQRNEHHYWRELVEGEMANLGFELINLLQFKFGGKQQEQKNTREEQIFLRFVQLLFEHSRTEREVDFYANKLCVTPDYLSRSVKCIAGKSAIKIIHEMSIPDATALLRKPDLSIQGAADAMNFPDRETFSKFFKKNTGLTPGEYKKKE